VDETLVRAALAEAEAAEEKRKALRGKGVAMLRCSDLERELARRVLERLSGAGDRNR
jgi:hypothetical protein